MRLRSRMSCLVRAKLYPTGVAAARASADHCRRLPIPARMRCKACDSLHVCRIVDATNYLLAGSAVAEFIAFIAFIARPANSLHVPCACNAMQRMDGHLGLGQVR